jgi:hypothetical protein
MAGLKYGELVEWMTTTESSAVPVNHPLIDGPARTFAASLHSVFLLGIFTAAAVHAEKLNQFAHDIVTFKKTGQLGSPIGGLTISAAEMVAAIQDVQKEGPIFGITSLADAAQAFEDQATVEKKIRLGLLALFSSTLVATWTAFEALAGDLWEAAINARPKLATGISKTISTSLLELHDFNVPRKMGTILREMKGSNTITFGTLEDIRDAYKKAFTEHADSIHNALKDDNQSLDALSLTRNLIVHKAGKCDSEYKRRAAPIPQLPQLAIGQSLMLDGDLVKKLMEPAIFSCRQLLDSVGKWLNNHPA